jgi:hypothetical protein
MICLLMSQRTWIKLGETIDLEAPKWLVRWMDSRSFNYIHQIHLIWMERSKQVGSDWQ